MSAARISAWQVEEPPRPAPRRLARRQRCAADPARRPGRAHTALAADVARRGGGGISSLRAEGAKVGEAVAVMHTFQGPSPESTRAGPPCCQEANERHALAYRCRHRVDALGTKEEIMRQRTRASLPPPLMNAQVCNLFIRCGTCITPP
eukprot:362779-Chlamydomonas_euryale.AAC.3